MISFQQRSDTFFVEELLHYHPSGMGDHRFVKLRKRDLSTPAVERKISETTGVPLRHIRRAGRKDAAATATQWFSWPLSLERREIGDLEAVTVLERTRHEHGLAVGHARGNRFSLLLDGEPGNLVETCGLSLTRFPNFYGLQRFGRDLPDSGEIGGRIKRPTRGPSARETISVLQSLLFNELLAARWHGTGFQPEEEDWWTASNGKRCFRAPLDDALLQRYTDGEIAPTGPMYGYKLSLNRAESSFLQKHGLSPADFRAWGKAAKGARRPLFVRPEAVCCKVCRDGRLQLDFELPSGAFATVLLLAAFLPQRLAQPMERWPDFTKNTILVET